MLPAFIIDQKPKKNRVQHEQPRLYVPVYEDPIREAPRKESPRVIQIQIVDPDE
jgi:hypothetical protein